MWKTFQHENKLYMLKLVQGDNLTFYLTDFQNVWTQNVSKELLLQQFQKCNPLFDIKADETVAEVTTLINKISNAEYIEITTHDDELQLVVKSVESEFKIEFQFNFSKASSDVFLREVTVPLIQTVKHLEVCQNMLSNLVQKKDRELEEYRLEKGLISREDLITEKFEESMLDTIDDKSMLNVFSHSKSFWDNFTQQYGNIEAKIEDVKKDPWNHMKRKRKVYSAKTILKRGKGINYNKEADN